MNCGGTSCEPANWLTMSHSVTSISAISMAKPSSSGTKLTRHLRRSGSRRRRDGCCRSRAGSSSPAPAGSLRRRAPGSAGAPGGCAGKVSGWRVRSSDAPSCGGGSSMPSRSRMSPTRGRVRLVSAGAVGAAGRSPFGCQREVEQAMGVVVGRAQHLAARHVLEGRRDAPLGHHGRGVERQRIAEARQGRAIGAQQEDGLDQVAARLLDGERGERAVVAGALGHHAIDGEPELLVDLLAARARRCRDRRGACRPQGRGNGRWPSRHL